MKHFKIIKVHFFKLKKSLTTFSLNFFLKNSLKKILSIFIKNVSICLLIYTHLIIYRVKNVAAASKVKFHDTRIRYELTSGR